MKHANIFNKYFTYDDTSPTRLRWRKSGKIAGGKDTGTRSKKQLSVNAKDNGSYYKWSIQRVLFEMYNGFEPDSRMYVILRDGNPENLTRSNLILSCTNR